MAILKHFAVKNADYGAVIDYLKYQHDEFHLVPILDENGNSMLRDEFYFDGLNCNPEAFDLECELPTFRSMGMILRKNCKTPQIRFSPKWQKPAAMPSSLKPI